MHPARRELTERERVEPRDRQPGKALKAVGGLALLRRTDCKNSRCSGPKFWPGCKDKKWYGKNCHLKKFQELRFY